MKPQAKLNTYIPFQVFVKLKYSKRSSKVAQDFSVALYR